MPGPQPPEILIRQPQPFDLVGDPILVCGIGRAFEGTIILRARDVDGATLAEATVQGGSVALANFQGSLPLGLVPPAPQGALEAFEVSAQDGSERNRVVVPVTFGQALDATYFGFHPHVVRQGETLSGLSHAFYGNPSLYPRIFEANRHLLTDPNVIKVGQVLRIPFGKDTRFPPGGVA